MKILIKLFEDWEEMYINDILVDENHVLDSRDVLFQVEKYINNEIYNGRSINFFSVHYEDGVDAS